MKKILTGMILTVMATALAACGNGVAEDREQPQDTGISISADVETDTIQDIQDQETDDTEMEAEENTVGLNGVSADSETVTGDTASDSGETDIDYETDQMKDNTMKITVGDTTFTAALADNSSAEALKELLAEGPLTIDMSDYGNMEKVGPIGTSLPRNDEQITTGAGDIILYQGNSLVIYYDTNSWNFTRIGKIDGVTREELLDAFGEGNVTVTFSLE